jgi:hypothetical protein
MKWLVCFLISHQQKILDITLNNILIIFQWINLELEFRTYFSEYTNRNTFNWHKNIHMVLGLELRAYTLSHSSSPFFVKILFEIESLGAICPCWLQNEILLISAPWIARVTVVSHWSLVVCIYLYTDVNDNLIK